MHRAQMKAPEYLAWELDDACKHALSLGSKASNSESINISKEPMRSTPWLAQTFSLAEPRINCSAGVALLLTRETAWWQGTMGLQESAQFWKNWQPSQPLSNRITPQGGHKHALVFAKTHFSNFEPWLNQIFNRFSWKFFKIMIFPFTNRAQSKRAVFKR